MDASFTIGNRDYEAAGVQNESPLRGEGAKSW